jgi:hypothetical protein
MLLPAWPRARLARGASTALLIVSTSIGLCAAAGAATVAQMFEATVPLGDRSEAGQAAALQEAMRQVLVRVTGQRDAAYNPELAPLVKDARRYMQQFRVVGNTQFFAGFDGARLESAISAAGQPLWGRERPATLVWLAAEDGARRSIIDAQSDSELKGAIDRTASLRGLPLIWPASAAGVTFEDVWSGSNDKLRVTAAERGADAILVGRGNRSSAGGWQVRWTLLYGEQSSDWRGSIDEGVHGAADKFAGVFAVGSAQGDTSVTISVSGVGDLGAYARVTSYLEALTLIRALSVDELSGDTVVYRAQVRGDASHLARAIDLGGRLASTQGDADPAFGASLSYRYRP